jgi:uncharacterized protein CbrC (UPF0167 family)
MIVTVKISRVYEIDLDQCPGDDIEEKEYSAKKLAVNSFADEMIYFEEGVDNFVSAEIIERRPGC